MPLTFLQKGRVLRCVFVFRQDWTWIFSSSLFFSLILHLVHNRKNFVRSRCEHNVVPQLFCLSFSNSCCAEWSPVKVKPWPLYICLHGLPCSFSHFPDSKHGDKDAPSQTKVFCESVFLLLAALLHDLWPVFPTTREDHQIPVKSPVKSPKMFKVLSTCSMKQVARSC